MRALVCVRWPCTGKIAAMADSAIGLNFDQPPDVHLNLLAEIAFHAAFGFNRLAQMIRFFLGQILDLFRFVDLGLGAQPARALLADAVDGR